jgi:hypothetical protein
MYAPPFMIAAIIAIYFATAATFILSLGHAAK